MKKKLLTMLLAVVMAFSLLPGTAFAASTSGSCGANVRWSYSNGTLTIEGTGPMKDYGLREAPWYSYREQIHTIRISDGVTSIGECAFYYCESLTSVTIPNSVTMIGSFAFCNCGSLTSVIIPNNVKSIGGFAFDSCTGLTSVTILDGVTTIEMGTFFGCSSLTSVTIPGSVTSIGALSFSNCESLTSITIPNSVKSMGTNVFDGCSSLSDVTISNSVTAINDRTFQGCSNLTSVVIPGSVKDIGQSAFSQCSGLTSVFIPVSVTNIDMRAFSGCNSLKNVYYSGNESQWKQIFIWFYNEPLTSAAIHYNSAMPTTPEPPAALTFTDVPSGEWYADAVAWAVEKEITNGVGNNRFAPGTDCSHIQILTMLWRAAGKPVSTTKAPVSVASYYQDTANWAYEKEMIDGNFDPEKPCTRADAVNYIWQAFNKPSAAASSFTDVSTSAAYAKAVDWAVEKGVTTGVGNNRFNPDKVCNRGEIVTFLFRAYVPEVGLTV